MSSVKYCILALAWWLLGIEAATACECVGRTFKEQFRDADLVFEGVVVSTLDVDSSGQEGKIWILGTQLDRITTFRVTRAIKSTTVGTQEIWHQLDIGACGIGFESDGIYRVLAQGRHGRFHTHWCSGTKRLDPDGMSYAYRPKRLPVPGETFGELLRQIRNPALGQDDAAWLFRLFQSREQDKQTLRFIEDYIRPAAEAAAAAAQGRISDYDGALKAANFYEGWGDYERAAEMYTLAERVAPRDAHFPAARGRALYLAGNEAAAIPHLERALRLNADLPGAANFLARARLLAEGRLTQGVKDYSNLRAGFLKLDRSRHPGIDLSGALVGKLSARGARLRGAQLGGASFLNADFEEADLTGAILVATELRRSTFRHAVLRNVYAIDTDFSHVRLGNADLRGMKASRSQFRNADLRGAHLERADFADAKFSEARLHGVRFRGADFSRASMRNAFLQGADLRGAILNKTDFLGARIDCGTRLPADLNVKRAGLIPVQAECGGEAQNRDFSGHNWDSTDFSDLNLKGASFVKAKFDDSQLLGTDLQNADFSGASGNAQFSGADLSNANFSGSRIDATFHGQAAGEDHLKARPPSVLLGTNFTGANLETAAFIGRLYTRHPYDAADYTVGTFKQAHLECTFGDVGKDLEQLAQEPVESVDIRIRKWVGEDWGNMSEVERREAREFWEDLRLSEARERKQNAGLIQAERKLVNFLREKWPSVTFDDSCQYYLAPSQDASSN